MTRRRKILSVVLLLAVGANLVWFSRPSPSKAEPDFNLDILYSNTMLLERRNVPSVPAFDPASNGWTADGEAVTDLRKLLTDPDPERIGADSVGKFLIVRLPPDASGESSRRALVTLAKQGICNVSSWDEQVVEDGDWLEARVFRLMNVRDERGEMIACVDRVNMS